MGFLYYFKVFKLRKIKLRKIKFRSLRQFFEQADRNEARNLPFARVFEHEKVGQVLATIGVEDGSESISIKFKDLLGNGITSKFSEKLEGYGSLNLMEQIKVFDAIDDEVIDEVITEALKWSHPEQDEKEFLEESFCKELFYQMVRSMELGVDSIKEISTERLQYIMDLEEKVGVEVLMGFDKGAILLFIVLKAELLKREDRDKKRH